MSSLHGPSDRLARALARLVVAAALTAFSVGATAFVGWASGHYALTTTFLPTGPSMNPITALAVMLASVALALARSADAPPSMRLLGRACAAVVVLLTVARLAAYAFHLHTPVDQLLFADVLATAGSHPSRMAYETALALAMLAGALLAIDVETRLGTRPAEALAFAAGTIGLYGGTGYVYVGAPLVVNGHVFAMAPITALAILLLASGVLAARPARGLVNLLTRRTTGSAQTRRLVPMAAALVWVLEGMIFESQRAGILGVQVGTVIATVAIIVSLVVVGCIAARLYDQIDAERMRAARLASHRDVQVRQILEHVGTAVFVKDLDGVYVFVNAHAARVLGGRRPEEVVGATDALLLAPDRAAALIANDHEVLARGDALQVEEHLSLADGPHTFLSVKFPLRDVDGRVHAICGIATDITARIRSEETARRLTARIATTNRVLAAMAASSDRTLYPDVLASILEAFESPRGVLGHLDDAGDLVCPTLAFSAWGDAGTGATLPRARFRGPWARAVDERRGTWLNEPHEVLDDRAVVRRSLVTPILHRGEVLGLLHVANRDYDYDDEDLRLLEEITVAIAPALHASLEREREERLRHKTESELRELTRRLQATNEGLESFSYSVSHDLRAPLRAIGGFAKILASDHAASLDDEGRRLLGIVSDSTRRMTRLIDDLLTFSRVDRRELARRHVDMTELARSVVSEAQAANPGHAVDVRLGALPSVVADPNLLQLVLANLVANAWKFTRGRLSPAIELTGRMEAGRVIYSVRDNGSGFDMRYVHKLFVVFSRLHGDEIEGTGVGLALVRRLVERHGGRVWADGRVDEGATFSFELPAGEEMNDEPGDHSDPAGGGQPDGC